MRGRQDRRLEEIESLYRVRFGYFVQVARAITGDVERARDVVQEAFATAISTRGAYRGEGVIEAWLWRIVVNTAKRSVRVPLVEIGGPPVEADAPAELLAASPLIARLPERQRLIVFLRYYAGLDYRSIAQALDVEVGTVSAALATAHAAIRKRLEEVRANG
jgi:RNA polymerase sigma factor (sigma-70 family)